MTQHHRIALTLLLTSLSQAAPPTTRATPDLSTPRTAALAWIDASWHGDAPAAHQILLDDPAQRTFASDLLRYTAALQHLRSAAVERFGEPGKSVTGYPDQSAAALASQLEIKPDNDRATASINGVPLPLSLRRVDHRWHVDLSDTMNNPRARRAAQSSATAARVADEVAADLRAGKFPTPAAAAEAFRDRRLKALSK